MAAIDLGSVMGPQGPQGSIWYQGTAITGTSTTAAVFSESEIEDARVYDKYFNTATNDVYTCIVAGDASTAKWAWIGNLRGAQGNIGPVGPTGSVDMNTPIEFTEAETRANIESGESVSTIFGKLKKVVGDLLAGAASTLLGQKLTAEKVLVSDADGNVGASAITKEELSYLDGVTGNIQGQIGNLSQLPTTDKSSLVAAISEQNVKLNKVQSFITQKFYFENITFSAHGNKSFDITTPTGYEFLCVVGAWTMGDVKSIYVNRGASSQSQVIIWSPNESAITVGIGIEVLYYKYL